MLPDRVSNPGPLTYESGALPITKCLIAENLQVKLLGLQNHSSDNLMRNWKHLHDFSLNYFQTKLPSNIGI